MPASVGICLGLITGGLAVPWVAAVDFLQPRVGQPLFGQPPKEQQERFTQLFGSGFLPFCSIYLVVLGAIHV